MKNTKFNWRCDYCNGRNIEVLNFQFDIPKRYEADWECYKCGKVNRITFDFKVETWPHRMTRNEH